MQIAASGRNAHMEKLRAIAMLMIIAHHMVYHGGLLSAASGLNRCIAQLLNMGGKLGVNLFVLIGAWHMCTREYHLRRTIRIWLQTVTTGVMLLAACGFIWGWARIGNTAAAFLQLLLPVSQSGYWFAGAYIVLTLLMPFLNVLIRSAGRRGMDVLLAALTCAMSLVPTLFIGKTTYFSPIFWFVYLYLLAGRLRRWPMPKLAKHGMKLFVLCAALIFLSTLLFAYLKERQIWTVYDANYYANRMETLPMLLASLGLFLAFARRKPRPGRLWETAGCCCFGVYLIHDHPYLRTHIWNELVRAGALAQSKLLVLYMPLAVAGVFAASMLIEYLRKASIGYLEVRLLDALDAPMARFDGMLRHELRPGKAK